MSDQNYLLSIPGMTCSGCAARIKTAFTSVTGIDSSTINLADRTVIVSGDVSADTLVAAIKDAGYDANVLNLTTE